MNLFVFLCVNLLTFTQNNLLTNREIRTLSSWICILVRFAS